jgi:GNAT superfamily N-acetyltransferase
MQHLRQYQKADCDQVVTLWYRTWHDNYPDLKHPQSISEWNARFQSEIVTRCAIWVVNRGEDVVGFMAMDTGCGSLEQLFVSPECQRQGIGYLLLEKAKQLCPGGLTLHTLQRNRNARCFYQKNGFSPGKESINDINGQLSVYYHWKGNETGQPTSAGDVAKRAAPEK